MATLLVGSSKDSEEATKIVKEKLHGCDVIKCEYDNDDLPELIDPNGIFCGIDLIRRYLCCEPEQKEETK